jgi:HlyD family secretion protein
MALLCLLLAGCGRGGEEGRLLLSGTVEADEVEIASRIPGQVEELPQEGEAVARGQVVARLDARELADQVRQAEAALAVARENLRRAELNADYRRALVAAGQRQARAQVQASGGAVQGSAELVQQASRQEQGAQDQARAALARAEAALRGAEARLREAESRASLAERERERIEELFAQGFVSAQQLDRARTEAQVARRLVLAARAARDEAASQRRAARGQLEEALALGPATRARQAQLRQARAGEEQARAQLQAALAEELGVRLAVQEVAASRARVREARAALDLARTRLGLATLRSPLTGIVTTRVVEPGEQIIAGQPLVRVARLDLVKVDVFVPEEQLGRVWLGMRAALRPDAPGQAAEIPGVLAFLSPEAEFTPKNVQTREERVTLTYRAQVRAANPGQVLKPGMPVDVVLDLTQTRPAGATPGQAGKLPEASP